MLSEVATFASLLLLFIVYFRRSRRLKYARFGQSFVRAGLFIIVVASFIDILFIGENSAFDIGFSNENATQFWRVAGYLPAIGIIAIGLSRILPAINRLNSEIEARIASEEKQTEQNRHLKVAIERAEQAENTLIDAIESMPETVVIFDADDRLFICNQPYRDRYQKISGEVKPGSSFADLVRLFVDIGRVPEAVGREEEWIAARISEHNNPSGSFEQESFGGKVFRLSETKMKSGGTVSIRTDISDIRNRERALEENRAKLEDAQAIAHIGNWEHNKQDKMHEWSDEVFRILGYEPGSVRPCYSNYMARVHKNDLERLASVFRQASELREAFQVEFRIVHPDKKVIYVRVIGRLDFDETWNVAGASGTLQDITAQHMFERELIQAKLDAEEGTRSKSLFLANMSHELRTPLNAVIGFSEVLAKEIFGPLANDRYREYADNIQSSGRHLLSLIDDILEYSRLEVGSVELQETEFYLIKTARSTETMLAAKAAEKSITIAVSENLNIELRADERKLKQVLINLVSNAIKFTPEKGHIELDLSLDPEGNVILSVTDDGFGISQEEIENVMRPFGRTQHSISKSIEGTGLGLPLARSIIELHGGELIINSNENKSGTTIEIHLPKSRLVDDNQNSLHLNLISR